MIEDFKIIQQKINNGEGMIQMKKAGLLPVSDMIPNDQIIWKPNKHDYKLLANGKIKLLTEKEKEEIKNEKVKNELKNKMITLQLKIDACTKLKLDISTEEEELIKLKAEYDKLK